MSRFDVLAANLKIDAGNLGEYANALSAYSREVNDIRRNLGFSEELSRSVGYSLQVISNSMNDESRGCRSLSSGLSDAVRKYEEAEQGICGKTQITWGKVVGAEARKNDVADHIWDMVYKSVVSAAGSLGTIVDAIRRGSEGKTGNVISDLLKLAGGLVKNTDGSGIKWADWFGLKPSTKGAWEGAIGKYTDFSTVQKGFSTVCNWAAEIASGTACGKSQRQCTARAGSGGRFTKPTAT